MGEKATISWQQRVFRFWVAVVSREDFMRVCARMRLSLKWRRKKALQLFGVVVLLFEVLARRSKMKKWELEGRGGGGGGGAGPTHGRA